MSCSPSALPSLLYTPFSAFSAVPTLTICLSFFSVMSRVQQNVRSHLRLAASHDQPRGVGQRTQVQM